VTVVSEYGHQKIKSSYVIGFITANSHNQATKYWVNVITHIIIIIIIIIGQDTISFMQGIYTYIPETNHVPKK
jgi:hypothetical protein